jgi:hypothetical protein
MREATGGRQADKDVAVEFGGDTRKEVRVCNRAARMPIVMAWIRCAQKMHLVLVLVLP